MPQHRLFVALRPPVAVREMLAGLMHGPVEARWQDDDQLHCTIRFIGEVDRHCANDIADMLGTVRHPPIDATLGTIGTFASAGRIHTLWVGIEPISALSALHAKVERRIARAGIEPDRRSYRPHMTLARFSRHGAPSADLAARLPALPPTTMRFDEITLYESHLDKTGARYEPIAAFPLR